MECHKLFFFVAHVTSPKTNMDPQNDGLEKVGSFNIWSCLVSISDF